MGLDGWLALHHIEVIVRSGAHHHRMLLTGSFYSSLCAPPAHHCSAGRRSAAFQYFIPADELFLFGGQDLADPFCKIVLKLFTVFEAVLFHKCLNAFVLFPVSFETLVAAHVDILEW